MPVNKVIYGNNTLIDLTGDTITSDTILEGYTAHDASGNTIIGTYKTQKYGKSVWIGDSIGQGYNNSDYSYINVADESGLFEEVIKYSVGGATLGPYNTAETADGYSGYEQIMSHQADITDADMVFLQFCANDLQSIMGGAITAGTSADSSETNSICGYVHKIIDKIYELNPLARIYYLNLCDTQRIIDMVADAYSSYFEQNSWGTFNKDAMRSAWIDWQSNVIPTIQEYGVQVINILEDIGLNSVTMPLITTNDYIHPNNDGHKRIFDAIMARIDTQTGFKSTAQNSDAAGGAQLQLVQLTNASPDMTTATSSKSSQEIYQDYLNGIITAVQIPATGNAVIMSQYTQDQIAALFLNMTDAVCYSLMQIKGTDVTLTNIPEGVVQSWGLSKNWAGQVESGQIVLANGKKIDANISN